MLEDQDQRQNQTRCDMIRRKCIEQSNEFEKWAENKQYDKFHYSHYDWWAFPINRKSSYGFKYKVFPQDKNILEKDQQFIKAIRTNSILVCESWGYNLLTGEDIKQKNGDQMWQDWPIRLYKLANSLQFFHQEDLFLNAIKFGLRLIELGNQFSYGPKDLKPLFYQNQKRLPKIQKKQQKLEVPKNIEKKSIEQDSRQIKQN